MDAVKSHENGGPGKEMAVDIRRWKGSIDGHCGDPR